MQVVCKVELDADEYVTTEAHLSVRRPAVCPVCKQKDTLVVLGHYERSCTVKGTGRIAEIKVRRFVCKACRRTVSMLPSFAQPYRLVCSVTIERYFNGEMVRADTSTLRRLLRRYWNRFTQWLPDLMETIGRVLGLPPPGTQPQGSWHAILAAYQHLDRATRSLVGKYRVTIFGKYLCHEPILPANEG